MQFITEIIHAYGWFDMKFHAIYDKQQQPRTFAVPQGFHRSIHLYTTLTQKASYIIIDTANIARNMASDRFMRTAMSLCNQLRGCYHYCWSMNNWESCRVISDSSVGQICRRGVSLRVLGTLTLRLGVTIRARLAQGQWYAICGRQERKGGFHALRFRQHMLT